jgi:hypothetical protein
MRRTIQDIKNLREEVAELKQMITHLHLGNSELITVTETITETISEDIEAEELKKQQRKEYMKQYRDNKKNKM